MGLLSTGTSLTWDEIEQNAEFIKKHGIIQFINIYHSLKNRENDLLKYGDEIEYSIVHFDKENKIVRLGLHANEVLEILQTGERNGDKFLDSLWRMEYASYMVEGTPGKPFCCTVSRLKLIETSMWLRKRELEEALHQIDPNLGVICFSSFPRLGCLNFTEPQIDISKIENRISNSSYFPDEAIFLDHPRFANLTRNIRSRLGHKQRIYVPVWHDTNTPEPFIEALPSCADKETIDSIKPNFIHMDCMGFGMGCSCLQITVQAGNVMEARNLYDQLAVIAPLLMALSACSPAWKGILSDWDCRWNIISMACDDRRNEELELNTDSHIRKSRYDSIDMYLHPKHEKFNDVNVKYNDDHYQMLLKGGVDSLLAKHIAHLFARDPISLFKEKLNINDLTEFDHFENFQSTNWQSCRFKPPPPDSGIGWRVEFRTLEMQFTCYENACFVIFVILLSRAIIKLSLDMVVPISIMEQNMQRAIQRDAINRSKFFFKSNIYDKKNKNACSNIMADISEKSLNSIFNQDSEDFIGLIPIIRKYVQNLDIDIETQNCINKALKFVSDRAAGNIMTPASWIRHFILNHPKYNFDSLISDHIVYDLSCRIRDMSNGINMCPLLYNGHHITKMNLTTIEAYKKMIRTESIGDTEKKLGIMISHKPIIKAATLILRLEIFESLYKQYLFYNHASFNHSQYAEII